MMRTKGVRPPRVDLPPEAIALYYSGAPIAEVGKAFGCSYDGARAALIRAGVQLRNYPNRLPRAAIPLPRQCGDCGERLDRPHVLGAHLPGCRHPLEAS